MHTCIHLSIYLSINIYIYPLFEKRHERGFVVEVVLLLQYPIDIYLYLHLHLYILYPSIASIYIVCTYIYICVYPFFEERHERGLIVEVVLLLK